MRRHIDSVRLPVRGPAASWQVRGARAQRDHFGIYTHRTGLPPARIGANQTALRPCCTNLPLMQAPFPPRRRRRGTPQPLSGGCSGRLCCTHTQIEAQAPALPPLAMPCLPGCRSGCGGGGRSGLVVRAPPRSLRQCPPPAAAFCGSTTLTAGSGTSPPYPASSPSFATAQRLNSLLSGGAPPPSLKRSSMYLSAAA